jgi:hypothetical protein
MYANEKYAAVKLEQEQLYCTLIAKTDEETSPQWLREIMEQVGTRRWTFGKK